MIKIDKRDTKILYELNINCRQPLRKLSKKIGLSKQAVDYRVKKLIKDEVIKKFYTVINFLKLGYSHYKLYVNFQNVDLEKEKEIIDYWVSSKNSIWVASCRGRWDLAISLMAKDVWQLGNAITNFLNKYAVYIQQKDIFITLFSPSYTKSYLVDNKEQKEFVYGTTIGDYELDEKDRKILMLLSKDARIPIIDIMEKTKLTRDTINYRMRKMKKDSIIQQYRALIDSNKIGYKSYKILLRLKNISLQKENMLRSYVKMHPNGVHFLKLLGRWDIEMEFGVQNEEYLYNILTDIRNVFADTISDYDTLLINKEHKLNYFPFGDKD